MRAGTETATAGQVVDPGEYRATGVHNGGKTRCWMLLKVGKSWQEEDKEE